MKLHSIRSFRVFTWVFFIQTCTCWCCKLPGSQVLLSCPILGCNTSHLVNRCFRRAMFPKLIPQFLPGFPSGFLGFLKILCVPLRIFHLHPLTPLAGGRLKQYPNSWKCLWWLTKEKSMRPVTWWPLSGLLSWYHLSPVIHCNSFENQAPVDFSYRYLTLKWIVATTQKGKNFNTFSQQTLLKHQNFFFRGMHKNSQSMAILHNYLPHGTVLHPTKFLADAWNRYKEYGGNVVIWEVHTVDRTHGMRTIPICTDGGQGKEVPG